MSESPFPPGHVLAGRYAVRRLLGVGGMGHVHDVEALATGARFALKAPLPELSTDEVILQRFAREAAALQLLDHPNIVRLADTVVDDGRFYLVLELIDGPSLADELDRGPLHPRRALVIARQVLDGLDHAHARGVVHRDLKPENIALTIDGEPPHTFVRVKLIDFGVVKLLATARSLAGSATKLTRHRFTLGTPEYMSPQQALGLEVDGRSDLYALGVIVFEMLTGRLPFVGKDSRAIQRQHVGTQAPPMAAVSPPAPWMTPAVEHLVARALVKPPDERWPDAAAMRDALDAAFLTLADLP